MGERFMLFEELLKDERAEGRAEGRAESILTLLEEKGEIPEDLREKIMNEKRVEALGNWIKLAAKADSIDQFLEMM